MAAEKLYVQETINNVKRALEIPSDASESDDTIAYTSNRGRKLKRKARFVHEGALDNHFGRNGYKEEIDYYGKKKKIIYRKHDRKRIAHDDSDDSDDSGGNSDADPYADVHLDKILAPLESAADLPSHPSLSHVYTSKTLNELIQQSLDKICEEHAHTIKLKNLLTKFMGDDPFVSLDKMRWPHEDHHAIAMERGELLFRDYAFANIVATATTAPDPNLPNGNPSDPEAEPETEPEQHPTTNNGTTTENGTAPPRPPQDDEPEDIPMTAPTPEPNGTEPPTAVETTPPPPQPPSPQRMTTRSTNPPPLPPASPTQQVDPFFLPPTYSIDSTFSLPPAEAEDTRRLLSAAVQRQDEFLRGLNRVRTGLLRAERLRMKVWDWCRTMEGMREYHARFGEGAPGAKVDVEMGEGVGLSDGEDWYDREVWGLEGDLEKGREEEDEGMEPPPGKKTRGRRN